MPDLLLIDLSLVFGFISGWIFEHRIEERERIRREFSVRQRPEPLLARIGRAQAAPQGTPQGLDDYEYFLVHRAVSPTHWN